MPNKAMSTIKYTHARDIIRTLNRANLKTTSYDEIKKKVHALLECSVTVTEIKAGQQLFRAHRIDRQPTQISRVSYPPSNLVEDYQRCNPPEDARFYCANDVTTACAEIRAKVGEKIYISNWSVSSPFLCTDIRKSGDYDMVSEIVATFVETKLIQEIGSTFSHQYKITAAICEVLTDHKLPILSDAVRAELRPFGINGIIYPSAAHQEHRACLAFKPVIADRCLNLERVEEIRVSSISDDEMWVTYEDVSGSVSGENIDWEGQIDESKVILSSSNKAGTYIRIKSEVGFKNENRKFYVVFPNRTKPGPSAL